MKLWRNLFRDGDFAWSLGMRRGEVAAFFSHQAGEGPALLRERAAKLDTRPEWYLAEADTAAPLVNEIWSLAREWDSAGFSESTGALHTLGRRWEPDLLVFDRETLSVAAGVVCFPSSWSLEHAVGKPLLDVHALVPGLNAAVGDAIERFLCGLAPGRAYRRENWGMTRSGERDYHPRLERSRIDAHTGIDELFLRVEKQCFVGLPSGVLMGIRIESCALTALAADPPTVHRLAQKIRTMPEPVAAYKGLAEGRGAILHALEQLNQLDERARPPGTSRH